MSTPTAPPPDSGDDYEQRVADFRAEHGGRAEPATAAGPAATNGPVRDTAAARLDGESTVVDRPGPELPPAEEVEKTRVAQSQAPAPTASRPYGAVAADLGVDRATVANREKEKYGGIKVGSAFFGWLAAAGMAVILTSLLTAAGVALSLTTKTSTTDINNQAAAGTGTAKTVGLVGAILLLVVLFVAYYCGGYVAARMARFNGVKQGLAVWLWGVVFAVVIFILVKIGGGKYNILSNLNLPRIPVDEGSLTTAAVVAVAAIIVVTLGAAALGGLAGMRFHRNVDKAGLAV